MDRSVCTRFKIGEKIGEMVSTLCNYFEQYRNNKTTIRRNRVVGIVEGLLKECQPTSIYAASTATILLTDQKFLDLVKHMKSEFIWSDDLERDFQLGLTIVLRCV